MFLGWLGGGSSTLIAPVKPYSQLFLLVIARLEDSCTLSLGTSVHEDSSGSLDNKELPILIVFRQASLTFLKDSDVPCTCQKTNVA